MDWGNGGEESWDQPEENSGLNFSSNLFGGGDANTSMFKPKLQKQKEEKKVKEAYVNSQICNVYWYGNAQNKGRQLGKMMVGIRLHEEKSELLVVSVAQKKVLLAMPLNEVVLEVLSSNWSTTLDKQGVKWGFQFPNASKQEEFTIAKAIATSKFPESLPIMQSLTFHPPETTKVEQGGACKASVTVSKFYEPDLMERDALAYGKIGSTIQSLDQKFSIPAQVAEDTLCANNIPAKYLLGICKGGRRLVVLQDTIYTIHVSKIKKPVAVSEPVVVPSTPQVVEEPKETSVSVEPAPSIVEPVENPQTSEPPTSKKDLLLSKIKKQSGGAGIMHMLVSPGGIEKKPSRKRSGSKERRKSIIVKAKQQEIVSNLSESPEQSPEKVKSPINPINVTPQQPISEPVHQSSEIQVTQQISAPVQSIQHHQQLPQDQRNQTPVAQNRHRPVQPVSPNYPYQQHPNYHAPDRVRNPNNPNQGNYPQQRQPEKPEHGNYPHREPNYNNYYYQQQHQRDGYWSQPSRPNEPYKRTDGVESELKSQKESITKIVDMVEGMQKTFDKLNRKQSGYDAFNVIRSVFTLAQQQKDRENMISDLQTEVSMLRNRSKQFERSKMDFEKQIFELKDQLLKKDQRFYEEISNKSSVNQRQYEERIAGYQQEILAKSQIIAKSKDYIDNLKKKTVERFTELTNQVNEKEEVIANLEEKLENEKSSFADQRNLFSAKFQEYREKFSAHFEDMKKHNTEYKDEIANLKEALEKSTQNISQEELEELKEAKNQHTTLILKIEKLTSENFSLATECGKLANSNRSGEEERATILDELAQVRQSVAFKEKQVEDSDNEIRRLTADIDSVTEKYNQLEAENDQLSKTLKESMSNSNEEMKQEHQKKILEMSWFITDLEEKHAKLQERREKDKAAGEEQIVMHQNQLNEAEEMLVESRKEIQDLEMKMGDLEAQLVETVREKRNLVSIVEELKKNLVELRTNLSNTGMETSRVQDFEGQISRLQSENDELTSINHEMAEKIEKMNESDIKPTSSTVDTTRYVNIIHTKIEKIRSLKTLIEKNSFPVRYQQALVGIIQEIRSIVANDVINQDFSPDQINMAKFVVSKMMGLLKQSLIEAHEEDVELSDEEDFVDQNQDENKEIAEHSELPKDEPVEQKNSEIEVNPDQEDREGSSDVGSRIVEDSGESPEIVEGPEPEASMPIVEPESQEEQSEQDPEAIPLIKPEEEQPEQDPEAMPLIKPEEKQPEQDHHAIPLIEPEEEQPEQDPHAMPLIEQEEQPEQDPEPTVDSEIQGEDYVVVEKELPSEPVDAIAEEKEPEAGDFAEKEEPAVDAEPKEISDPEEGDRSISSPLDEQKPSAEDEQEHGADSDVGILEPGVLNEEPEEEPDSDAGRVEQEELNNQEPEKEAVQEPGVLNNEEPEEGVDVNVEPGDSDAADQELGLKNEGQIEEANGGDPDKVLVAEPGDESAPFREDQEGKELDKEQDQEVVAEEPSLLIKGGDSGPDEEDIDHSLGFAGESNPEVSKNNEKELEKEGGSAGEPEADKEADAEQPSVVEPEPEAAQLVVDEAEVGKEPEGEPVVEDLEKSAVKPLEEIQDKQPSGSANNSFEDLFGDSGESDHDPLFSSDPVKAKPAEKPQDQNPPEDPFAAYLDSPKAGANDFDSLFSD